MADPPVNSLLMYTPDEIDFAALSDDTLRALALEIDPFIATSALAELATRGRGSALAVARALLDSTDDRWLRAAAFEIVLDEDPATAMRWAGDHAGGLDDDDLASISRALDGATGWEGLPGSRETRAEIERRRG